MDIQWSENWYKETFTSSFHLISTAGDYEPAMTTVMFPASTPS